MTINHFLARILYAMADSFQKKCDEIKKKFINLNTQERYQALMEMGKQLPPFPESEKTPNKIVPGCQSTLYLSASLQDGKLFFEASADALISAGLAALLIAIYSGESPETILQRAPDIIRELGISSSLSPNRSNGLTNIYLRMKQEALMQIVAQQR
jgi:cysteine desulfuration protein SufE